MLVSLLYKAKYGLININAELTADDIGFTCIVGRYPTSPILRSSSSFAPNLTAIAIVRIVDKRELPP